ncbi:MAG: peptidylprolyl isomerase [Deltaproteobacteria bacterium]|nr:peptidylprolyl isomerase [Deltaproteobacteria bacterium]
MRTAAFPIMAGAFILLLVFGGGCSKSEKTNTPTPGDESQAPSEEEEATEVTDTKSAQAPDQYTVELDTTKGPILIEVHHDWSPHGAERFYELVQNGYYSDVAFFRVIDGFMAQAGINGDPALNAKWRENRIPDDPVKESNTRGTLSFATSGPNSRTTQFFINLVGNSRLDGMGFSPFGKLKDMTVVDALYAGYGEGAPRGRGPSQALLQSQGNTYLKENFPNLDYIKSAKIIE